MAEAKIEQLKLDDERWMHRLAWVVMWVLNASGKLEQPVTVDDLLGKKDLKLKQTLEEKKKEQARLEREKRRKKAREKRRR